MAQFKYLNEINNLLGMDGPITKGPMPRWQKKGLENSNNSINVSLKSTSSSANCSGISNKTPTKRIGNDIVTRKTPMKTPSKNKSPSRSFTPTPNKNAKTPTGGDRFIPIRNTVNFDLGYFKFNQSEDEISSPQKEMQRIISENLHGNDISKQKILAYQNKAPAAPEGFQNPMRVLYTQTKTPASVKGSTRHIPTSPDRILDAPDIVDDYYLNLMDWSNNNLLAIALGANVYLWDAGTGNIQQLPELNSQESVCSLSWIQEGDYLAIGTVSGNVELWDCNQMKRVRVMAGHVTRVGSLSWNSYILTSGCRTGQIINHDVRNRDHIVGTVNGHTQEVCGLKWSTDGKYLASGGNDNLLNIWSVTAGQHFTNTQPLYTLTSHQAAVKALGWCPWKPNLLASGGGTADRCIKFWNINTGTCLNSIDTKSQVCCLAWSSAYNELVSGHGFANNQLIIWKYPLMNKVAELTGHTARILHLAISPDGTSLLSAGADETLRLWKCFMPDPAKKKETSKLKSKPSALTRSIR